MQIQSISNMGMSWNTQREVDSANGVPGIQSLRQDQTNISPAGKLAAVMEQLTAQKEATIQQREELVNRTVAAGNSLESIKEPLKFFDEKLEGIDQQMADAREAFNQQQIAKLGEQSEDKKKETKDEEVTREEVLQKRMTDVVDLSGRVTRTSGLGGAKVNLEAAARIQHAHARSDGLRSDLREIDLKVRILENPDMDPTAEWKSIGRSRAHTARLESAADLLDQRAAAVGDQVTGEMSRINKELEEDKENAPAQTPPTEDEQ